MKETIPGQYVSKFLSHFVNYRLMHVSVTLLIYWYIFLTTVNTQETSEIVMVDKNVPPNHWYFYVSVTKIHPLRYFAQIFIL